MVSEGQWRKVQVLAQLDIASTPSPPDCTLRHINVKGFASRPNGIGKEASRFFFSRCLKAGRPLTLMWLREERRLRG
jgi:hypothetical protein